MRECPYRLDGGLDPLHGLGKFVDPIIKVAAVVLDGTTRKASLGGASDRFADTVRRIGLTVLKFRVDRQIRGCHQIAAMGQHLFQARGAFLATGCKIKPGAGGCQCLKANLGQHASRTAIPGVRDNETAGPAVQGRTPPPSH